MERGGSGRRGYNLKGARYRGGLSKSLLSQSDSSLVASVSATVELSVSCLSLDRSLLVSSSHQCLWVRVQVAFWGSWWNSSHSKPSVHMHIHRQGGVMQWIEPMDGMLSNILPIFLPSSVAHSGMMDSLSCSALQSLRVSLPVSMQWWVRLPR